MMHQSMNSLRQLQDWLPLPNEPHESEFDPFGAGHTTISAGLLTLTSCMQSSRMAVARDLKGEKNSVVPVIGACAMTAGQAYEAMNNAGCLASNEPHSQRQRASVAATVGALSSALSKMQSSKTSLS